MINYTIRPLCTGYQLLDKGWYSTFRRGHGQILEHPVFAFLIEGGGRKILVDTGMSDTERSQKYHHDGRQFPPLTQPCSRGAACPPRRDRDFPTKWWDHGNILYKVVGHALL